MSRRKTTRAIIRAIAVCGLLVATHRHGLAQIDQRYSVASRPVSPITSKGLAAIDVAAHDRKYLFMFFWKANDEQSRNMRGVFQSAMKKWIGSTNSIGIQITDSSEKAVVEKFGLSRAPMPMALALAPNGAITKAFPITFDEDKLRKGFVSPCTASCLKCLQDHKLTLLCIQNERTQFAQAAMSAALNFKADPRYSKATEILTLNPEDKAETALLRELKVNPQTPQAVTVLLAPPGQPVATFVGAVTKDEIVSKVQAGPCAGGKCGPGGCCPK